MRPTVTDVAWSVCLCVCWSQTRAVLKRINWSRCRFGCGLVGPREPWVSWSSCTDSGTPVRAEILGRAETFPRSIFSRGGAAAMRPPASSTDRNLRRLSDLRSGSGGCGGEWPHRCWAVFFMRPVHCLFRPARQVAGRASALPLVARSPDDRYIMNPRSRRATPADYDLRPTSELCQAPFGNTRTLRVGDSRTVQFTVHGRI